MLEGHVKEGYTDVGLDEESHDKGGHDDPSQVAVERISVMKSPS